MTPLPRSLPRRTVLAASGTALLATAAACSSSGTAANPTPTQSSAAAPSAATTAPSGAAGSTAAGSTAAGSIAGPSGAAPTGTPLASVADVEAAGALVVGPGDAPVLLAAANGTVVAHTAICTHQGCTVAASGACPCHGSKFDVQTGAVQNPPALQPLAEIAVTVSGGQVYPA